MQTCFQFDPTDLKYYAHSQIKSVTLHIRAHRLTMNQFWLHIDSLLFIIKKRINTYFYMTISYVYSASNKEFSKSNLLITAYWL